MKAHVLCVDDNRPRLRRRRKSLKADGFVVLSACDETQAVNLLKSHPVDVVCVHSAFVEAGGSSVGADLKRAKPDVSIVLIRGHGAVPASFREHVDVVFDGPDFDDRARCVIEAIYGARRSFFLQWLNVWMHHASGPANDASRRVC